MSRSPRREIKTLITDHTNPACTPLAFSVFSCKALQHPSIYTAQSDWPSTFCLSQHKLPPVDNPQSLPICLQTICTTCGERCLYTLLYESRNRHTCRAKAIHSYTSATGLPGSCTLSAGLIHNGVPTDTTNYDRATTIPRPVASRRFSHRPLSPKYPRPSLKQPGHRPV